MVTSSVVVSTVVVASVVASVVVSTLVVVATDGVRSAAFSLSSSGRSRKKRTTARTTIPAPTPA